MSRFSFIILTCAALCPTATLAEGLEAEARLQFNIISDYDQTLAHRENTIQAGLALEYEGLSFELEAETLQDEDPDSVEVELSFGYAGELSDALEWNVAYSRTYLDASGWAGHDLSFGVATELSDATTLGFTVIRDLSELQTDLELALEFDASERWSFELLLGYAEADDVIYGEAGAQYALNDDLALEFLYEDAEQDTGTLTLSAVWTFSLTGD